MPNQIIVDGYNGYEDGLERHSGIGVLKER